MLIDELKNLKLKNWSAVLNEDEVLWLELNKVHKSTNTLSSEVRGEFGKILSIFEKGIAGKFSEKIPAGLVIHSKKRTGFCAGADVNEFVETAEKENWEISSRKIVYDGWYMFEKLEQLSKKIPTIALVRGFCFGGALELALSCRYIVAIDEETTSFSLPEVKLGIYPGWGGIKRLPQKIGPINAMNMMLSGSFVNARKAYRIGLADVLSPARTVENSCIRLIKNQPKKTELNHINRLMQGPLKKVAYFLIRRSLKKKAIEAHYPAPFGILDLWLKQNGDPTKDESIHSKILGSRTAKNLLRVFLLREKLKSLGKINTKAKNTNQYPIKHIHVIGAGTMGGDIAIWCVLQGFFVSIQDLSVEQIARVMKKASRDFSRKFKNKYKQKSLLDNLIPDLIGSGVKKADVIIEAATENLEVKRNIFSEIEREAKSTALLCSNTSSIKIEEISKKLKDPNRLVGVHFFNPVLKMPLVEIIKSNQCDQNFLNFAMNFTSRIKKLPLPVKSSPGFLVNAVLMPYLQSAMRTVDNGISPEDIDYAMKSWGMPMGPLELVDTVGLDICIAVGETITQSEPTPICLEELTQKRHFGKKTNQGFYKWEKGRKVSKTKLKLTDTERRNLAENLIKPLIQKTISLVEEGIVESEELADAGVIFGTGFAPFLGGPIHYHKNK